MDSKEDFTFLLEHKAEKFNPFQEGEYLVIQTRSKNLRLHALHRGFDYRKARSFCEMENMASDYNHYTERVVYQGKLHHVDDDGQATKLSSEQNWLIHEQFYNARFVENLDCQIEVCACSYPVFWSWEGVDSNAEPRVWSATTCLVDDFGRKVTHCPNCHISLEPEEVEEEDDCEEVPAPCVSCGFYNSDSLVACAIHPLGLDEQVEVCADYSP
jgi:hypothetical protein